MKGLLLTMSDIELERLEVLQAIEDKRCSRAEGAVRLGLSLRQLKRLLRVFRDRGAAGLVSRRRGRPSNRRIDDAERSHFVGIVSACYADFAPTLAAEYLRAEHGFSRSTETLRSWMSEAGLWRARRAKSARAHPPRLRRPRVGELVQIDGSPHDWLEGRGPRMCLIGFIDDATSRLMLARFFKVESTHAYLECLSAYVERHGVPAACYSDRHSIFTKHDPEDPSPTQFERALGQLGIESIQATSPQAKGRIERVFQTLQDRLVKALRLAGVSDMAAANEFLTGYLETHNPRFAKAPAEAQDAHQPWEKGAVALSRICASRFERTLSKDLVVTFKGQRYIIQTEAGSPRYALRGKKIEVCVHLDGRVELLNDTESLPYRVFDPQLDKAPPADDKTLNERVEQALAKRGGQAHKPAQHHPWKKWTGAPALARVGKKQTAPIAKTQSSQRA
jgi:transposase